MKKEDRLSQANYNQLGNREREESWTGMEGSPWDAS